MPDSATPRTDVGRRLLDAARTCVLDRGISRVTMSDVARGADVSRTTLYRHYPDVDAVLRDLMTLEFGGVVQRTQIAVGELPTARERMVASVVGGCRGLRANELFRKIVDVDPEYILPYITARAGQSQRTVEALLEGGVVEGQADGSIRAGDPRLIARLVLVQAQAFTVSVGTVSDGDPGVEDALLTMAGEAFDAQLRPR